MQIGDKMKMTLEQVLLLNDENSKTDLEKMVVEQEYRLILLELDIN